MTGEARQLSPDTRPSSRAIVVLPAFNEEANLPSLLQKISDNLNDDGITFLIIVVDDGSSDRTPEILAEAEHSIPLLVIRHQQNEGLGQTIHDGLQRAVEIATDRDVIITMDADETHTPGLVLRMLRMIREGHDVVIASRYQPGSRVFGLSLHRRIISRFASVLMRILFPTSGVHDYTCGYRAYRAEALRKAHEAYGESFVDQGGFQCMVDILLKLRRLPLIFGEVPMILRYDVKQGQSKMKLWKTSVNTLRLLARRRLGNFGTR